VSLENFFSFFSLLFHVGPLLEELGLNETPLARMAPFASNVPKEHTFQTEKISTEKKNKREHFPTKTNWENFQPKLKFAWNTENSLSASALFGRGRKPVSVRDAPLHLKVVNST